jgi:hypothetical protein
MRLRNVRFPILLAAGILAAAGLLYFSQTRIGSELIQGAIGKRDVYRDAQVNSADVDKPGTAPVAVTAILQSSQFGALAKNPDFKNLLSSQQFQVLSRDQAFVNLLANSSFQVMASNAAFLQLVQSASFQQALSALKEQVNAGSQAQALNMSLRQDSNYQAVRDNVAFNVVLSNVNFAVLASNQAFVNLLASASFQSMVNNQAFVALVNQSQFQNALLQGSAANLALAARVD